VVALAYGVCALIWGTTWFAIRASIAGFPPFVAVALRFTIAAFILWMLIASGRGRPLPRGGRAIALLVVAGLLNGFGYLLVYTAERRLPGGLMAVLFGTIPLVTALAATAMRIERVSRAQLLSALIGLAGVAVIALDRGSVDTHEFLAVLAALGAVVCSVGYSILVQQASDGVHPFATTAVFLTMTTVVSWVAAIPSIGDLPAWPFPLGPTLATLYLAVLGSVVAFVSYFYLLQRVSLMVGASLVLVQPIIALLVDAAFEHRAEVGSATWLGMAITLSGVAINLVTRVRAARASARKR
jgi:drug/metabolite transporter (DMT)-like permease